MLSFYVDSLEETHQLGKAIGESISSPILFSFTGELGTGKTEWVKALGEGLRVRESIVSPTFTLIHEYPASPYPLVHVDLYRLEKKESIDQLGLEEYFEKSIVCIEWADRWRVPPSIDCVTIQLFHVAETKRQVLLTGSGKQGLEIYNRTRHLLTRFW